MKTTIEIDKVEYAFLRNLVVLTGAEQCKKCEVGVVYHGNECNNCWYYE